MTYVQRRKHPALDIVKIYSGTHEKFYHDPEWYGDKRKVARDRWNDWLSDCRDKNNCNDLMKAYYGLQVGMDDASKQKLNSEKICVLYTRLLRSIENELVAILKKKETHVLDNPLNKKEHGYRLQEKKNRDQDIQAFLKRNSF